MTIEKKTVIVTGAASGMGRASAELLAARGARVVLADVNAALGAELESQIVAAGRVASFRETDLTSREQVRDLVSHSLDAYGSLDVLVHAAAIAVHRPFLELDDELWRRTIEVCLTGTFYINQEVAKVMAKRGGGRIINFTSLAAAVGGDLLPAYSAAKAGVIALSKTMQKELARHNVVVILVSPGATDTPMYRVGKTEEKIARQSEAMPFGRVTQAQEVAEVVAFLASDASGATLAGQTIHTNAAMFMGF